MTSSGRRVSMTKGDLSKAVDGVQKQPLAPSVERCSKTRPRPGLSVPMPTTLLRLRKRDSVDDDTAVMPSCNSDFLSGIFKDIASATTTTPSAAKATLATHCTERPTKKTKISMTRSISRCNKSFANLSSYPSTSTAPAKSTTPAAPLPVSPESTKKTVTSTVFGHGTKRKSIPCVSSNQTDVDPCATTNNSIFEKIGFPHLPATVSNSSCTNMGLMSRTNSGLQLPDAENSNNASEKSDCYGWFVEMDDDHECVVPTMTLPKTQFPTSVSSTSLAFSAATAPKSTDYAAEVQWAQAADTVDDVLGDFF
eukprot:CAMPEP_0194048276 /NCGR_PEP_ID=MMETSP0009_2-20130614/26827_1 /TAXON_ID=210454 /ORGANISM="Grammatophora oceanica, Strain CCMP 410" /LENGTH=308 /DNA_ID=CAMNT_0038694103 /DNA_START=169 /DNA_END=1095 /DNA_ORIENTATION=-